jgi:MFS family permease
VLESPEGGAGSIWAAASSGLRLVASTPRLRAIVGLLWVAALFVNASEGIATPLGLQLQGTTAAAGLLLAANPAGTALGGLLIGRFCPPHRREGLLAPLLGLSLGGVLLAGLVPLVLDRGTAAFAAVLVLFFLAGIGGAANIPLNVAFVQAVPSAYRGRAFGVAASGLSGFQGLGAVLAGVGADVLRPSTVVALAGGVGLLGVLAPLLAMRHDPAAHRHKGRPCPRGLGARG